MRGGETEGGTLLDGYLAAGRRRQPRGGDRVVEEGTSGAQAGLGGRDVGLHGGALGHGAAAAGGLARVSQLADVVERTPGDPEADRADGDREQAEEGERVERPGGG